VVETDTCPSQPLYLGSDSAGSAGTSQERRGRGAGTRVPRRWERQSPPKPQSRAGRSSGSSQLILHPLTEGLPACIRAAERSSGSYQGGPYQRGGGVAHRGTSQCIRSVVSPVPPPSFTTVSFRRSQRLRHQAVRPWLAGGWPRLNPSELPARHSPDDTTRLPVEEE
jgi:hypothetical protein